MHFFRNEALVQIRSLRQLEIKFQLYKTIQYDILIAKILNFRIVGLSWMKLSAQNVLRSRSPF